MSDSRPHSATGSSAKVLYYGLPPFLDHVPSEVAQLAGRVELHVLFEVPQRSWASNPLGIPLVEGGPGLRDFRPHLRANLPDKVYALLEHAKSLTAAVYPPGLNADALRVSASVHRAVRALRPDVLHFDGESARGAFWSLGLHCPMVVNVHEPRVISPRHMPELVVAKWWLIRRADVVVVHSSQAALNLSGLFPTTARKCVVIPMGTTDAFALWGGGTSRSAGNAEKKNVLFFGRLTERKGIDQFMAAADLIAMRTDGVRFLVAGAPDLGYTPPRSRTLSCTSSVDVRPGRLPPDELATLVRQADVIVLPYRDARQSGVILTAYALGTPVIVTDIPGLREQVIDGETGLLVRPGSAPELAFAIDRVITDHSLRMHLREGVARAAASRFSWTEFGPSCMSAYESAISTACGRWGS